MSQPVDFDPATFDPEARDILKPLGRGDSGTGTDEPDERDDSQTEDVPSTEEPAPTSR